MLLLATSTSITYCSIFMTKVYVFNYLLTQVYMMRISRSILYVCVVVL